MQITKKNILAFLKEEDGAIHFAGLLREFGGRHVKSELKRMLDDMAADGELVRHKGNSYSLATAARGIRGKLQAHRDGYGFVTPEGGGEDIFIPLRYMKSAMHGDTVEVQAQRSHRGEGKMEGRITSVSQRASSRIVGRYEETRRGAILIPEEQYELVGQTPSVVFTCGAVTEDNGEIKLYYGGADTVQCVATTTIERLIDACYNR